MDSSTQDKPKPCLVQRPDSADGNDPYIHHRGMKNQPQASNMGAKNK